MTRNDARALFASSGLDYSVLTKANLRRLISLIDQDLKKAGLMRETYRMRRVLDLRINDGRPTSASLRCKAFYFDDREAVSFNPDGFVGFAGWASDENVAPILSGFERWCEEMRKMS